MKNKRLQQLVIIFLSLPLMLMAQDYMALGQKLSVLRTEVESLNKDIEEVRKNYNAELRSYSLQRAELEASIRKEEIKTEQLRIKIGKLKMDLSQDQQSDLKPLIFTYIEKLSRSIEEGFPFKKEERLDHLEKIKMELKKGSMTSYQALSRLWSAFEDEGRLARENQLSKEQIVIDGKTYLAEIVKLGTVALFFRLENGTLGQAVLQDNEWKFVPFSKKQDVLATQRLFLGFKKQIKVGEYLIPTQWEGR